MQSVTLRFILKPGTRTRSSSSWLLLAFFSSADDALEAMIVRCDLLAAQASVSKMAELFTWLKNTSAPQVDGQLSELFATLIRAGMPMEQVAGILQNRPKKGKGAPVLNRLPVLLAVEQRKLNPQISWMQLAVKYCQCSLRKHDHSDSPGYGFANRP